MKLRTKLVFSFFFLAIVPLVSIVAYSYHSSLEAFRAAVEAESQQLADGMNQRMAAVRDDLDHFLGRATELRFASLEKDEAALIRRTREVELLREEMADLAPLVETYEFIPAPPPVRDAPRPDEEPEPHAHAAAPVAPRERFVFKAGWLRPEPRVDDTGAHEGDEGDTQVDGEVEVSEEWQELLAEGTRIAAGIIDDPDALEKALEEHGEEIASRVINMVVSEGGQIIAEAIEDPEGFEQAMANRGLMLKHHILEAIPAQIRLTEAELAKVEAERKRAEALLGRPYTYEIWDEGQVVGHVRAQVSATEVLDAVLTAARRDEGEVPFAVDSEGEVHTLEPEDQAVVSDLELAHLRGGQPQPLSGNWVVVATEDSVSGTTFGIARPVGDALHEIRRTAFRNMAFGMMLVAVAGFGILPLSRRITRHLATLTRAADALAAGDLSTRVPVRSRDEFGKLATAFNRMAGDLDEHQGRLLEEERLRREQEVETSLLELENRRKGEDLEAARLFQLSLLPDSLPEDSRYEIAVSMRTATEVGGDYYDFRANDEAKLTVAFGDATGHGAAAGTMVTAAKSLFTAAKDLAPASFLERAATVIRTMRLGRMSMALALVRLDDDGLVVSMAGMPPLLVHRQHGRSVEEVIVPGMPLGSFRPSPYREVRVPLATGDTVLMMSDGFPELLDEAGEPLGYERAREHFAKVADKDPQGLIAALDAISDRWRGNRAQADDVTFVVLRKR